MKLNALTRLKDNRTECFSVIFELKISDYLELVTNIYKNKGGIKEQREPLKSSSAMRIRKQMVRDIQTGTILPPIVLGLIVTNAQFAIIPDMTVDALAEIISSSEDGNLTIIDGMQRTTALFEAIEDGGNADLTVRVEFWISTKLNSLIYRMLVLNTGQVPWNLRRQIETIFSSMINEIKISVPEMEIYLIDDVNRRSQGGQYHASDVIELYLAYGGRKEKVDTKERLADEFTRLDFIEATENLSFSENFYQALEKLTLVDKEFSRFQSQAKGLRFSSGKDLFRSQPARVGFITAIAKKVFGRPGIDKNQKEITDANQETMESLDKIISKLQSLETDKLGSFLSLELLSEKLSVKSSRVGDFEREFFTKSFETFIEEGNKLTSMDVCWLSF